MNLSQQAHDKLFITEILNDIGRSEGCIPNTKAGTMLRDWSAELREKARVSFPASRLRKVHAEINGSYNW